MADDLPADHDVIVVGTGMPESIVAAAVARIGQRVLHLDKEAHYGSLWASYNFENLREWMFGRQDAVLQEQLLNMADTEALLKPGETFIEVPQHYASITNAKEIINMPEVQPETQDEEHLETRSVLEPAEFTSDTSGEPPFIVPPASRNSQVDSASSSVGDLLPTSSSSETAVSPTIVPPEQRLRDTSGTDATTSDAVQGSPSDRAQNAESTSREVQQPSATVSAEPAQEGVSSQTSDSQTESENVAGVCPCPNFIGGGGAHAEANDAATTDTPSVSETSSIEAMHSGVPRPEDVTDNSQETSVGPVEPEDIGFRGPAQKQEKPKEWSLDQFLQLSRKFNLDLAPKLLFSRGPMVELLISSNIARYAEFKAVSRILTHYEGTLHQVPCSRADVFGCKEVQLVEKRMLMKFLMFCLEYHKHPEEYRGFEGRPFKEFLRSKGLTAIVEHYVLHAIAMCDEDIPTLQGLKASQKFLESLGRYGNSPFLSSLFGSGELPQCFCRLCAVFGGIYHLQRGPAAIIRNANGDCVAMVSNGRRFNFKWLIMESSYAPLVFKASEGLQRVSRAIVITNKSLYPAEKEQITLLRLPKCNWPAAVVIQELGPGMMMCPNGLFVIHMTCPSVHATAEEDLTPAVKLLFENASCKDEEQTRPKALYTLFFNCEDTTSQRINQNAPPGLIMVSSPGPHLDYEHAVQEAKEIFHTMYPNEEFLPRAPDPEEILIQYENNPGDHSPPFEAESEKDREEKQEEPADRGDCVKSSSLEESSVKNSPTGDLS